MVLIVYQLDLQALSKFNYCHIYFDCPRYCIRSCKLNSYLSNSLDTVQLTSPVPLVPERQRYPLPLRRHQATGRQHPRSPHADDCREPHRGKRRDGEGGSEPYQSAERVKFI